MNFIAIINWREVHNTHTHLDGRRGFKVSFYPWNMIVYLDVCMADKESIR